MEEELRQVIERVIESHVPKVRNRKWLMDYLFKYTVGNKLPRGKDFSSFRIVENRYKFNRRVDEYNHDIERLTCKNRISPLLLQQRYLLMLAVVSGHVQFNTNAIIDVIKKLENESHSPSTDLIKHKLSFRNKGLLAHYKHHHVPLLPNSYLRMYAAQNQQKEMIHLDTLVSLVDKETNTIDLHAFEGEIKNKGVRRSGRLTGHWLITKQIEGEVFYLGVFPHSNGVADDRWIKKKLVDSERAIYGSKLGRLG